MSATRSITLTMAALCASAGLTARLARAQKPFAVIYMDEAKSRVEYRHNDRVVYVYYDPQATSVRMAGRDSSQVVDLVDNRDPGAPGVPQAGDRPDLAAWEKQRARDEKRIIKMLGMGNSVMKDLAEKEFRQVAAPLSLTLADFRMASDHANTNLHGLTRRQLLDAHHRFKDMTKCMSWSLAFLSDWHGFVNSDKSGFERFWEHVALGSTTKKGVEWLLTDRLLEPWILRNNWALRSPLSNAPLNFGKVFFKDVVGTAKEQYLNRPLMKGIRAALIGEVLDIGIAMAKGARWDSPAMAGHYADIGLVVLYSYIPPLAPLAPWIGSVREMGTDWSEGWSVPLFQSWFHRDTARRVRALDLYAVANMALHGIDRDKVRVENAFQAFDRDTALAKNRDYQALKSAAYAGDALGALGAFRRLKKAMRDGGIAPDTLAQMERALSKRAARPVTFKDTEQRLGGVALNAEPALGPALGQIESVVVNPRTNQLVLVGDGKKAAVDLSMEDLAAAFASVFGVVQGRTRIVGHPQFSLDPYDPKNPDGPWQRAVYVPGYLYGTRMGDVMYQADWLMKQYSFGLEVAYLGWFDRGAGERAPGHGIETWGDGGERIFRLKDRTIDVDDLRTIPQLSRALGSGGAREPIRNRLWLVVAEKIRVDYDNGTAKFGPVKIGVEARRQVIGPDGTLQDVHDPAQQNPAAREFARQMTLAYDELTGEPPFAGLKTMAKAVAIAMWVKSRSDGAIDLSWVPRYLNRPRVGVAAVTQIGFERTERSEERVPVEGGVKIVRSTSKYSISGGADLKVDLDSKPNRAVAAIEAAVDEGLRAFPTSPVVPLELDGTKKAAVVVPLPGERRWRRNGYRRAGDHLYAVTDGRVTSATDGRGVQRTYQWEGSKLRRITARYPQGWTVSADAPRDGEPTVSRVDSDDGQQLEIACSRQLDRCAVRRNGKPVLEIKERLVTRDGQRLTEVTTVHSSGTQVERSWYDAKGRLAALQPVGVSPSHSVEFERTRDGEVESIRFPRGAKARVIRDQHRRVKAIQAREGVVQIEYHKDYPQLPIRLTSGSKVLAEYQYDAGLLSKMTIATAACPLAVDIKDGRLQDIQCGRQRTKLAYHPNGLLQELEDQHGQRLTWARDGRMEQAELAGGITVRAEYDGAVLKRLLLYSD